MDDAPADAGIAAGDHHQLVAETLHVRRCSLLPSIVASHPRF
jgi:hypothetical protein